MVTKHLVRSTGWANDTNIAFDAGVDDRRQAQHARVDRWRWWKLGLLRRLGRLWTCVGLHFHKLTTVTLLFESSVEGLDGLLCAKGLPQL